MKINKLLSILLLSVILLSACTTISAGPLPSTQRPDEPVSSNDPTVEPNSGQLDTGNVIIGEKAIVEEIQIQIMESFPVQVSVKIHGNLPDGCTTIKEITAPRNGEAFNITILTQRPADKLCTEALVPFEKTVSLDVFGLPAGDYTVKAYDQIATFTLSVDNVLQDD